MYFSAMITDFFLSIDSYEVLLETRPGNFSNSTIDLNLMNWRKFHVVCVYTS